MKNIPLLTLMLLLSWSVCANVRLPKLISDGMVLQRDANVKVWGWADANERIKIDFAGKSYTTTADAAGDWFILLPSMPAGGPFRMVISANNQLVIKDILIGDVWVCSGQSNMETTMERVSPRYPEELANVKNDFIRYFAVPNKFDFKTPQKDLDRGSWQSVSPATIPGFSAVAYFFAKDLYAKYQVPVGLIMSALGGSPAECWMSEEALKAFPHYYEEAQKFKDDALIRRIQSEDAKRIGTWYADAWRTDDGMTGSPRWFVEKLNTTDWNEMNIPGYWADGSLGMVNGVVWFRKDIEVPAAMAGKEAKLLLGCIVDADSVYVNGVFVGTVSYQYPPRRYTVPAGLLKSGINNITVRVINNRGRGGFVPNKDYCLSAGGQSIDLTGAWKYKLGTKLLPLAGETFIRWKPVGLYNAMLHPLLNYRIKGVIWYQGESNVKNPEEYKTLFPAMIKNWRQDWKQGDFPFLFVQLANFMEAKNEPTESSWAALRDAQRLTLSLPNTAMAVAIDIGEWNDIHPLNKKDVGGRLALAAQKVAYGDNSVVYSGPTLESMHFKGKKAILTFGNVGSGLMVKGGESPGYFAIAGADGKFSWASAKMKGNRIIVWNKTVIAPAKVRYAWADNPEGANLYNKEGLPASPFEVSK
jgi:sialate O-acetylesterase